MEPVEIIEVKKKRTYPAKGCKKGVPKLDVIEHVRKFNLPQSFPSSIKSSRSVTVERIMAPQPPPLTALISKEVGNQLKVSNKLQKLRLQAPDGREIGEINVQVLPQNQLGMQTSKMPNKIVSVVGKPRQNIQLQNVRSVVKNAGIDRTGKVFSTIRGGTIKTIDSPQPTKFRSAIQYPPVSVQMESQQANVPTPTGVLIPITPVTSNSKNFGEHQVSIVEDETQSSKVFVVQSGNNWQMIKFGNNQQTGQIQTTQTMRPRSVDSINPAQMKIQAGNSNRITVKPITLDINNVKSLKTLNANGLMKKASPKNQVQTDNLKRRPNSVEQINNIAKKRFISDSRGTYQSVIDENQLMSILQDESTSAIDIEEYTEDMRDNTIVVLPAEDMCRIEAFESSNLQKKIMGSSKKTIPQKKLNRKVSLIGKKDGGAINQTECDSTNSPAPDSQEKDMSNQLSIVGKALQSIEDEELREKALKALADCGIGLERFVPTKPPPDQTAIADSSTQTLVFGLVQPAEFVRVSEDDEKILRMPERTHVNLQNNSFRKEQPTSELGPTFQKDLDKMVSKFCKNPNRINKVNEMMKSNPTIDKVYTMLKEDFNNVTKYDNDGRLNIHKAVLSNQARAVRRQLMILRACKLDVDVPTKNGETALELAIQYQARTEIVQLLLEAKANPTSLQPAHDSALTIACQQQTPLISLLIEHVEVPEDLDQIDSTGFAAIHYCTQNGNSEAVAMLLRAGADLDLRDQRSGRTPVFHALENEHIGMTRELLQRGAKPSIQNFSGHNLFTLYDEMKHYNLKDLLTKSTKT